MEVRVTLWPEVELPNYKDRDVEIPSPEVTEEDIEAQVTRMLEQFSTVEEVDRPAEEGDFVSVDVEANADGVPVDEAKATDLLYEVGSGVFIKGLDTHVLGAEAGATLEFEGPLPAGFGDRAGEEVAYTITVAEVKERVLPALDDEWVDENTEFESVEGLRTALEDSLGDAKLQSVSRQFAEKALSTLVDQIDVDLPEALVKAEMDDLLHRFVHSLDERKISIDDYFQTTGIDPQVFQDDLKDQAEWSLRRQLVLEAVASAEEIEVSDEDLSNTLQALAAQSEDPVAYLKAFRESDQGLALASDIVRNRALDAILSNANAVDEEGNPVDLSLQVNEVEAEVVDAEPVEGEVVAEAVEENE